MHSHTLRTGFSKQERRGQIDYLSWVRHVYRHYAINSAYPSFDTYFYSHFIDEEVRTTANDFSDAAASLWWRTCIQTQADWVPSPVPSSMKYCFGRRSSMHGHLHCSIVYKSKKWGKEKWLIIGHFSKLWEINPVDYFAFLRMIILKII